MARDDFGFDDVHYGVDENTHINGDNDYEGTAHDKPSFLKRRTLSEGSDTNLSTWGSFTDWLGGIFSRES